MTIRELAAFCQAANDSGTVEVENDGEWEELELSKLRTVLTADQLDYVEEAEEEDGS